MSSTLESVIRDNVELSSAPNSRGFYPVLCKVCGDHGRKGKRAGFTFGLDGVVGYNCFNCGHKAKYDPVEDKGVPSKSMVEVLDAFDVPSQSWQQSVFGDFTDIKLRTVAEPSSSEPVRHPVAIELPPHFYQVTNDPGDLMCQAAIEYMELERNVKWTDHKIYLSRRTNVPELDRWYGRVIIPVYRNGHVIFYQGRDMSGIRLKKYISCDVTRENVLYGFDQLYNSTSLPLYVVEGWFDAVHLNGAAIFSNELTQGQIYWLSKSPRPKIVVPDRLGRGFRLAQQAIKLGWSVSLPEIGKCKDVSDAVAKYGTAYVLKTLRDQTFSGFEAETMVGLYCK